MFNVCRGVSRLPRLALAILALSLEMKAALIRAFAVFAIAVGLGSIGCGGAASGASHVDSGQPVVDATAERHAAGGLFQQPKLHLSPLERLSGRWAVRDNQQPPGHVRVGMRLALLRQRCPRREDPLRHDNSAN